jgi:hypothetical protein
LASDGKAGAKWEWKREAEKHVKKQYEAQKSHMFLFSGSGDDMWLDT